MRGRGCAKKRGDAVGISGLSLFLSGMAPQGTLLQQKAIYAAVRQISINEGNVWMLKRHVLSNPHPPTSPKGMPAWNTYEADVAKICDQVSQLAALVLSTKLLCVFRSLARYRNCFA